MIDIKRGIDFAGDKNWSRETSTDQLSESFPTQPETGVTTNENPVSSQNDQETHQPKLFTPQDICHETDTNGRLNFGHQNVQNPHSKTPGRIRVPSFGNIESLSAHLLTTTVQREKSLERETEHRTRTDNRPTNERKTQTDSKSTNSSVSTNLIDPPSQRAM